MTITHLHGNSAETLLTSFWNSIIYKGVQASSFLGLQGVCFYLTCTTEISVCENLIGSSSN